jgi:D-proline reductase (dithiol) PrdB
MAGLMLAAPLPFPITKPLDEMPNTSSDTPISYIDRTTNYYLGLGYDNPYQWAKYDHVPFSEVTKPLAKMRVGLVTTAALYQQDKGDQGPGAPYNAAAKFYEVYRQPITPFPDVRISHVAIDRDHTTAEDMGSYFPLKAMLRASTAGIIGEIAEYFFGFPTNRSQRRHLENDAPRLVDMIMADHIDAVIAVPNCPVCHQSIALAMRQVEEAGIPTVIMGCAKDIVERAGVPRFYFSDFPLGNGAGRPHDTASQDHTLRGALELLTSAKTPRSTVTSPLAWKGKPDWKDDYSNLAKLTPDEIAARRLAFDQGKAVAAKKRKASSAE